MWTEIFKVVESGVSLPILVALLVMVRNNRKRLDEYIKINRSSHYGLHKKIERLPCMRDDQTPCPSGLGRAAAEPSAPAA